MGYTKFATMDIKTAMGLTKGICDMVLKNVPGKVKVEVLGNSLYASVDQGASAICTLHIYFEMNTSVGVKGKNYWEDEKDGEPATHRLYRYNPQVSISWSSTSRTVSKAYTAICLYQEMTKIAAMIESRFDDETVGEDDEIK